LDNTSNKDIVAKVKIVGYEDYVKNYNNDSIALTLIIQIKELYKGKVLGSIVKLRGDNGNSWQMYTKDFEKGKMYYIQYDYKGMLGMQGISACGENSLLISKSTIGDYFLFSVEGCDTKSMKLIEFENELYNTLNHCANLSFKVEDNLVKQQIKDNCVPENRVSFILIIVVSILIIIGFFVYRKYKLS